MRRTRLANLEERAIKFYLFFVTEEDSKSESKRLEIYVLITLREDIYFILQFYANISGGSTGIHQFYFKKTKSLIF